MAYPAAVTPSPAAHAQQRASFGSWLLLAPMLGWLALFVIIPALVLLAVSFSERDTLGRVVYAFTAENYLRAFEWKWLKIFSTSVWYALLTTLICLLIGYPAAYYIGRANQRWRALLLMLVMIPFWTSFLIRTYAWINILAKDGLLSAVLQTLKLTPEPVGFMYTPFAVVLGLVYNFLPFMILPIYTSVEKLDGSLIEAAYDLGARPWRVFTRIILPLTAPGIAAGLVLVFVPAIAMFAITTLMGGGTIPNIGEVIFKQFTSGRNQPFGAALGTILLFVFILCLWLSRSQREKED